MLAVREVSQFVRRGARRRVAERRDVRRFVKPFEPVMPTSVRPWIDVDWSTFNPCRVQGPLHHRVMEHPLLQWDALMELGKRLEPLGQFRTHTNQATAGTSFNDAPRLYRNRNSATDVIANLADAKAWMSLLNVQTDAVYRALVDEILGSVQPGVEAVDPGMSYRAGWIFLASPKAVTPFHFDAEHNFILQLQGHKTLYVWDPQDLEAASEHARDLFHSRHDRSLLVWRDALRERARKFRLEPGIGAYMPSTSPHMVENDDNPSLTISFTYYTDSTRRDRALHSAHMGLRRLGVTPPAVGVNRPLDATALTAYRWARGVRSLLRGGGGNKTGSDAVPYASHTMS